MPSFIGGVMKQILVFISIYVFSLSTFASPRIGLLESRKALKEIAEKNGGYTYSMTFEDDRTINWYTTLFKVRDESVLERSLVGNLFDKLLGKQVYVSWDEKGEKVGSHVKGHPVKTLEELHDECENLVENASYSFAMSYFENGVIKMCEFVDIHGQVSGFELDTFQGSRD